MSEPCYVAYIPPVVARDLTAESRAVKRMHTDLRLPQAWSLPLQVIAGQVSGTLFNVEAADRLAADVRDSVVSSNGAALTGAATARDMALNARTASRALQSAPSEARISHLHICPHKDMEATLALLSRIVAIPGSALWLHCPLLFIVTTPLHCLQDLLRQQIETLLS